MKSKTHYIPNGAGWLIELKQCFPKKNRASYRPLLIVPGYGMNSFIFGYHPSGLSMEEYLTDHGFETWSLNLRNQGGARCEGGSRRYSLKDLACTDLAVAIDFVLGHPGTRHKKVDLIGCSLGGTLAYLHVALNKKHRVGTIAAMGAPLSWEQSHVLVRWLFYFPKLLGWIPVFHTRWLVRAVLPLLLQFPKLLEIYLHPDLINKRAIGRLTETVENPNRFLNEEIARWIKQKDLVVDGKNLTAELRNVTCNLICILANSDGVVPMPTALSAYQNIGTPDRRKEILVVGTEDLRFAHADLFVSDFSQQMVFAPLVSHLRKMN